MVMKKEVIKTNSKVLVTPELAEAKELLNVIRHRASEVMQFGYDFLPSLHQSYDALEKYLEKILAPKQPTREQRSKIRINK